MRIAAAVLIAGTVLVLSEGAAMADDSVYLAMSNRIGLIAYCRGKGHLSDEVAASATARVTKARSSMTPAVSPEASARREDAGRNGLWGSRRIPAEKQASVFGQTLAQYCAEQAFKP